MADFYQSDLITTLHRLSRDGVARMESELERFKPVLPIGLALPALYSEFETPAMRRIVDELSTVRYLQRIVVALGRANRIQYEQACDFVRDLPVPVTVLWMDGPGTRSLFRLLEANGLSAGEDGKGRSCWLAYGYLLACGDCEVIALHDCDILNYRRELLARLCYPVANPALGFEFSKGYYARVTNTMHGRVTRLFVTPLVHALESLRPGVPFLRFVSNFRYVLAGEFAMRTGLARTNRIPGDWGLEAGVLAEVYRNVPSARICQVDLTDNYEHKHQPLCPNDPDKGLRRMSRDIAKTLFRTIASEGPPMSPDDFRALQVRYERMAQETIHRYYADAMLNGLVFDRFSEEQAVCAFSESLREAAWEYLEDPMGLPLIPNWNRVIATIPDFLDRLVDAVEEEVEEDEEAEAVNA